MSRACNAGCGTVKWGKSPLVEGELVGWFASPPACDPGFRRSGKWVRVCMPTDTLPIYEDSSRSRITRRVSAIALILSLLMGACDADDTDDQGGGSTPSEDSSTRATSGY